MADTDSIEEIEQAEEIVERVGMSTRLCEFLRGVPVGRLLR